MPDQYDEAVAVLDRRFSLPDNFGIVRRALSVGSRRAVLYYTEGLCDTQTAERVIAFCKKSEDAPPQVYTTAEDFCAACISFTETELSNDPSVLYTSVMGGSLLLLTEPFPTNGILIKSNSIPTRSLSEPEHDKVLRGAHIGFVETLTRNCAMIRRLMPDPSLIMKPYRIGQHSKTKVVVCYMRGKADDGYLSFLDRKLSAIRCDAMCLGTQSLAECLVRRRVWNPFPRFRYTERPDAAAASLVEGSILILCENAPQAMILPVSVFSFLQETNDFYLAPFTGSYLRILRLCAFILAIYLTPVWYAAVRFGGNLPEWLSFFYRPEPSAVPVLAQLLLIELAVDCLKLASMNTPNALSNSLSVIGGLILGDLTIEAGWFMQESILYMAVVSIVQFTQHNYELGYAFKYVRVAMLLLVAFLGWWGILIGTALLLFLLLTVPALQEKQRYFYPLVPFNGAALFSLFFRKQKDI
ncbi:MAG: spore germination protein [Eubacteriales bacterium]